MIPQPGRCRHCDSTGNRCSHPQGHRVPHLIPKGQRLLSRTTADEQKATLAATPPFDEGLLAHIED
jgi:hypothetical protein